MTGKPVLASTPHSFRVGELEVPQLEGWGYFKEGEELVWQVRNATSAELHIAADAPQRQAKILEFATALVAGGELKIDEFRKVYGLDSDGVPADVTRKIDLLMLASVKPMIGEKNRRKIVELSETHPLVFNKLVTRIDELSGMGAVLGKPRPSGKDKK